jgi:hypothetical protein
MDPSTLVADQMLKDGIASGNRMNPAQDHQAAAVIRLD